MKVPPRTQSPSTSVLTLVAVYVPAENVKSPFTAKAPVPPLKTPLDCEKLPLIKMFVGIPPAALRVPEEISSSSDSSQG